MFQMPPTAPQPKTSFVGNFTQRNASYAVGNRVYNGSAPSPHAGGGLDPSGYQERDALARTAKTNLIKNMMNKKGM